jgi:hypothetical protein
MKKSKTLATIVTVMVVLSSCGGNSNRTESQGVTFNPTERTSSLTDAEREEAIAAKRAALAELNIDSILAIDGVKFSVLSPSINDNVSQGVSDKLTSKIIGIAGQCGVGGLCVNPVLGLVTRVECVERNLTGTVPQKAIIKYELTLYCGNFITNEIYASTTVTISGVGGSFESAAQHSVNELTCKPNIRNMFKTASENAIKWYSNESNLKRFVDKAVAEQNYGLAMALLSSVPSKATTSDYATKRNAEISEIYFQSKADELLAQMEDAIAGANGHYDPMVGAYYQLIPHRSSAFAQADKSFRAYSKLVEDERKAEIARDEAREIREYNAQLQIEMEKLAVEKAKAPYDAQIAIEQIKADAQVGVAEAKAQGRANANTGGFLGLGKLWDNSFSFANKVFDNFFGD